MEHKGGARDSTPPGPNMSAADCTLGPLARAAREGSRKTCGTLKVKGRKKDAPAY